MFAAISGLKTHQIMMDVTANDIANVNTIGYKGSRTTFADSLAQLQRGGAGQGPGQGGSNPAQVGLGTQLGSIDNVMSSGSFQSTGNTTDLAIQGSGWFRLSQGTINAGPPVTVTPTAGTTQYTRAGNFRTNDDGYLVTADGYYVLGRTVPSTTISATPPGADQLIQIPQGGTQVAVGADGSVSYIPAGSATRTIAGYVSLANFSNESGLQRASGNRWTASAASGPEEIGTPGGDFGPTVSGELEMSNVDLATEFTNMISAQRGFQANSRVISTADDMLNDLVNLKR
ncbi:MAG TPA: flagellar hook-basal body complex protein [Thermoleophilaceae bacterium]|jgi:flagellar hook protein FlgE